MGCGASKSTPANSARLKEEVHKPSRKTLTEFDEILAYKNGTDQQFITLLCTSPKSFNPTIADEEQESENNIETINAWELLAGLGEDDDNEFEEAAEKKEEISSKNLNSIAMKVEKGLRRKIMASELCTRKVATFEMTRTASLRDWLMQGGQGKKVAGEVSRDCEENVFDPVLVAQLEKAMEDLTSEEEEILKQIMDSWEGNVRKVF